MTKRAGQAGTGRAEGRAGRAERAGRAGRHLRGRPTQEAHPSPETGSVSVDLLTSLANSHRKCSVAGKIKVPVEDIEFEAHIFRGKMLSFRWNTDV